LSTSSRACIFCGDGLVTREDAWPVWLVKQVGKSNIRVRVGGRRARSYTTNRIEQKVGCACRPCNNGWMSQLESITKPILGPVVSGQELGLTGLGQATLAIWALKTLMVFDWMDERYWRQEERYLLRTEPAAILSSVMVVAADYSGTSKANARPHCRTIAKLGGEDTGIPMFRGVLTVGRALFMVDADRYKERTGRNGIVWPPRHFDRTVLLGHPQSAAIMWPPPRSIDDQAFLEFIDASPGAEG